MTTTNRGALGRPYFTIRETDALLDGLAAPGPATPRPKFRAAPVRRAEWKALAIRLRGLMREGKTTAQAGGLVGVTPDKARRILAEWPASKLG